VTWLTTFKAGGLASQAVIDAIPDLFAQTKVLRVTAAQADCDPLAFWREAGETLGLSARLLEDSVTGEQIPADHSPQAGWMDVRFEPDRLDTYRHANVGQPLHSDGAYASEIQDIGLFYLQRQASQGGESLFADAADIAARAASLDPDLRRRLFETEVKFGKGRVGRVAPILREVAGRLKINWNWFRVLPDQGDEIAALREDFRVFLDDMVQRDEAVAAFRLNAGDAVFFRDDEVVHGRRAYAAQVSGDRLLWKTYFISPAAQATARAAMAA
jgi:alpha-ketoglutarate-dependent taurine dioxygenase